MGGRGDGGGERSWPGCVCMEACMCLRTRTWLVCITAHIGEHISVLAESPSVGRHVCVHTRRDGARPRVCESVFPDSGSSPSLPSPLEPRRGEQHVSLMPAESSRLWEGPERLPRDKSKPSHRRQGVGLDHQRQAEGHRAGSCSQWGVHSSIGFRGVDWLQGRVLSHSYLGGWMGKSLT